MYFTLFLNKNTFYLKAWFTNGELFLSSYLLERNISQLYMVFLFVFVFFNLKISNMQDRKKKTGLVEKPGF